jgi:DNA-directed RNA polymerase specialized sigma24 family protein
MGESFQVRYKQVNRPDAEKITTEYLKPIFGFALKRCKNVHDAEDLSQDIVLKAFRALLIKDDIGDVSKFIWAIAHNALSNYYRDAAKSVIGVSVDEVAEMIADPDAVFDDVKPFRESDAWTAAKSGELWGYINRAGEWVIEPKYQDADAFSCGFAPVFDGEAWSYIDETQNVVIKGSWEQAKPFTQKGLAAVYDGTWNYIQLRFINK